MSSDVKSGGRSISGGLGGGEGAKLGVRWRGGRAGGALEGEALGKLPVIFLAGKGGARG